MRTTVRLPDDLYTEVRVTAAREGRTVTSFLEEALRQALERRLESGHEHPPYRIKPLSGNGLQPSVDINDNAALLDLMEEGLDIDARR